MTYELHSITISMPKNTRVVEILGTLSQYNLQAVDCDANIADEALVTISGTSTHMQQFIQNELRPYPTDASDMPSSLVEQAS